MSLVLKESGSFRDISHYFHFMELLLVAVTKMREKNIDPKSITEISIPHWPHESWKGKEQPHNEWVIKCVFPNATVNHVEPEKPLMVIDREFFPSGKMNKTWRNFIRKFDPYHWSSLVGLQSEPFTKPVVTYINRQKAARRRLGDETHKKLVSFLESLSGVTFQNVFMEDLSFEEQVKTIHRTDLLISVHGNGLTHAAFMKPHRNVVEIFVPGVPFQWDYYTLSKMMGHEYTCIFNGTPVLPYMFTLGNQPCQTEDVPVPIIQGIIEQIKEEAIR